MRFSLLFGLTTTALETLLGFFTAYLLYSKFRGNRVLFTFVLTPMMMAPSLFGLMNRILFNNFIGLIPGYIKVIFGVDVDFFSPNNVIPTLVFIDLLQWTPFVVLILYATLLGIPRQLVEAARIDGARPKDIISKIKIIIPFITPSMLTAASLRFMESFRVFDTIYVLTGGGPGNLTTSISVYIYKTGFEMGMQSSASAAGIVLFLIMLLPAFASAKLLRRRW